MPPKLRLPGLIAPARRRTIANGGELFFVVDEDGGLRQFTVPKQGITVSERCTNFDPPSTAAGNEEPVALAELESSRSLGEGASGSVLLVRHKHNSKRYALKMISLHDVMWGSWQHPEGKLLNEQTERYVLGELEFLRLSRQSADYSQNLLRLHNAYFHDCRFYVLMEYMGEGSLAHFVARCRRLPHQRLQEICERCRLQRSPRSVHTPRSQLDDMLTRAATMPLSTTALPEPFLGVVAEGCLKALDFIHTRQKVHRDIKPHNILLCGLPEPCVKVGDFGIIASMDTGGRAYTPVGSRRYMAPERLGTNSAACAASDIWSLGTTILEVALGHYPFPKSSQEWDPQGSLSPENAEFPEFMSAELTDFLLQCLQTDSDARPSAKQLLHHQFITAVRGFDLGEFWCALMKLEEEEEERPMREKKHVRRAARQRQQHEASVQETVAHYEQELTGSFGFGRRRKNIPRPPRRKVVRFADVPSSPVRRTSHQWRAALDDSWTSEQTEKPRSPLEREAAMLAADDR
eukprot:TRINITY_DN14411_c0_g1_i1.p1 TRINITY_DN14411_c0_g1~~TRINITY_DN14411_c0_g1_i1.p1  ORF type:complete len:519 (+),score=60.62 TRINITY_DN14411_c0_g1_i1:27-1583(+)